ncbi:MAG TPA: hypothetical protein VGW11_06330 [Solirubrobacteraceae bacterium]|nr:hypothetical protein [Solirubrobacteraceae bacterium]
MAAALLTVGLPAPAVASGVTAESELPARIQVCAETLNVTKRPNEAYLGRLEKGQSMLVRKLSASGKYAYGFAYGDANKIGWVLTSGLC